MKRPKNKVKKERLAKENRLGYLHIRLKLKLEEIEEYIECCIEEEINIDKEYLLREIEELIYGDELIKYRVKQ